MSRDWRRNGSDSRSIPCFAGPTQRRKLQKYWFINAPESILFIFNIKIKVILMFYERGKNKKQPIRDIKRRKRKVGKIKKKDNSFLCNIRYQICSLTGLRISLKIYLQNEMEIKMLGTGCTLAGQWISALWFLLSSWAFLLGNLRSRDSHHWIL